MTNKLLTIVFLLLATTNVPVLAQSNGQDNGSVILTQPRVQNNDEERPVGKLSKLMQAPKACCGAIAGVTIGVPVRVLRDVSHESKRMTGTLHDDFSPSAGASDQPDPYVRGVGSMVGMLYGVPSGIILGTIHGTSRGIDAGFKKPFSKE